MPGDYTMITMNKSKSLAAYCEKHDFELKPDTTIAEVLGFLNHPSHGKSTRKVARYKNDPKNPEKPGRIMLKKVCKKCGNNFNVIKGLKRENAELCRNCGK